MAISFVGAGALASGDAPATLTPALPGGTQAGDLIFAFAFDRGGTANVVRTPPSGYTALYTGTTSSLTAQFYYKVHSGSESNPVFSWSGSAWATPAADAGAQVAVFRGVDTSTPINVLGTTSSAGPGSADIGPIATFTPTASGAAIVAFGAKRASIGGAGFAVLSGDGLTWNEIGDHSVALGTGVAGVWDYALGWTSGAITAKTFDTASTSTQSWVGKLFSLKPAATPTTTITAVPASATASRPVPLPKLKATAPRASATASRPAPLPKLTVVSPVRAATASRPVPVPKLTISPPTSAVSTYALLESANRILLESGDSLTQEVVGAPLTSAASATASRAVPSLQTTAARILHSPAASASASFPIPIATSSGTTAVVPPASATASRAAPTLKVTLTAPKGSASASALTPLPRLRISPAPAFATAFGLVPNSRTVVIGVPTAGASAQAPSPIPKIALLPSAASATAMGVPPDMPTPSGQFLARLPTHLAFARNTTTLVLEGAEIELAIDG